jgi:hypothetical protein
VFLLDLRGPRDAGPIPDPQAPVGCENWEGSNPHPHTWRGPCRCPVEPRSQPVSGVVGGWVVSLVDEAAVGRLSLDRPDVCGRVARGTGLAALRALGLLVGACDGPLEVLEQRREIWAPASLRSVRWPLGPYASDTSAGPLAALPKWRTAQRPKRSSARTRPGASIRGLRSSHAGDRDGR